MENDNRKNEGSQLDRDQQDQQKNQGQQKQQDDQRRQPGNVIENEKERKQA